MKIKISWKIWLLISLLILSVFSIMGMPMTFFQKGVLITNVERGSDAFEKGLREGQIVLALDGKNIADLDDFSRIIQARFPAEEKISLVVETSKFEAVLFSNQTPAFTVAEIPKTRIRLGLDLAGGARALVKSKDHELNSVQVNDLVNTVKNRLNVYGIADMNIRPVSDLEGNNFMLVEIAGTAPSDLEKLISEQGKFEAKIRNETVFFGGERDISSVSRSGSDSGIYSCDQDSDGYFCNFRFSVYLDESAAKRFAEVTSNASVDSSNPSYLTDTIDFYLDDVLLDSLKISADLRGRINTQISISGFGRGRDRYGAIDNANEEMHRLQTILITGSLPYKLEIVKLDTISPAFGKDFIRLILLAGVVALFTVSLIIFFTYKKIRSSLAILATGLSEILIILGVASLIGWNLDLPSIAGILATIGTGVDSQIIILDEARRGENLAIKQKIKRAFVILIGAYLTSVASLIPLYWAAAGFFKGFAITTIIGITAGILITRPAFSEMIKRIEG